MARLHFSLRSLLWFVAIAAIGCAAMVNPTEQWLVAVSTCTFGMLAFSVLAAVHGRADDRAFWSGFAIVGWGYLALFGLLWYRDEIAHGWFRGNLGTTRLLFWFSTVRFKNPSLVLCHNANTIGEFLWSLVLGFAGGLTARWLSLGAKQATQAKE
jgi:hypothetical protein